ncbi:MAG: DUF1294 domain-containing protein [Eubacteriales bacterium]
MNYILIYLLIINLFGLFIMHLDKGYAKKHHRRIPEKTLLLTAAIGGIFGIWVGMYLFHHKTKKPKFHVGVPAILVAQIVILYALFNFGLF